MKLSPLFSGMNVSVSGLAAQRQRLNTIAENIANAETTRTPDGGPYRRKQVALTASTEFSQELDALTTVHNKLRQTNPNHIAGKTLTPSSETEFAGVTASVVEDASPFREVYDPGHPDADENGMVKLPNVDIVSEMTDLISASRAFEANVTAFNATKSMMKKSLDL